MTVIKNNYKLQSSKQLEIMKIEVNKNQQEINKRTHIWTVTTIAKEKANAGITSFYYPIPRDADMSAYEFIDAIEDATEDSVYGGYKCISDGSIKFSIRS